MISGGLVSLTLLYKLVKKNWDVKALTFVYGQRHKKEIESAKEICKILNVKYETVDISTLHKLITKGALTGDINPPEVPETIEHYDTLKQTIVPNRNSIFLSITIGHAITIGATHVFYGSHMSDRVVYPDCRKEFVEKFNDAEKLANAWDEINIVAPFVEINKFDIVKLGNKLGVPYELTWSCYKDEKNHCGVCSACRERKRAFQESGIKDPTIYENESK